MIRTIPDFEEKLREIASKDADDAFREIWLQPVLSVDGVLGLAAERANWLGFEFRYLGRDQLLKAYAEMFVTQLQKRVNDRSLEIDTALDQLGEHVAAKFVGIRASHELFQ